MDGGDYYIRAGISDRSSDRGNYRRIDRKGDRCVNHIPLIGGVNRFLGFFAGGFQGVILVWLLFALLSIMSVTSTGGVLTDSIEKNTFLSLLYQHNLVLSILGQVL